VSVISFKEIHSGRDGADELGAEQAVRRYTRVFRAVTDSNTDEAATVLAYQSCPSLGSIYPHDISAYCRRVRARNESFSKRVWIVTCAYSSEYEREENPLADPAHITWNSEQFQRPCYEDRNGKAILNSAGDYFDPTIEADDSRWTVTVRKNLAWVPSWLLNYRDAVNSTSFQLDGITFSTGQAKMQAIQIGPWQERNDISFRVISMTMHLKREGWALRILDQGFREKDPQTRELSDITNDKDGNKPTVPALLNGQGQALVDPTPENAVILSFDLYEERDFRFLPLS